MLEFEIAHSALRNPVVEATKKPLPVCILVYLVSLTNNLAYRSEKERNKRPITTDSLGLKEK